MGLHSQDNPVGSLGNGPRDAHPSATEQEVDGTGATQILVLHVDNQLPLTAGTLSQANEAAENNLQGAVGHTSNPSASNGTAIDVSTLVLHPAHDMVQQGDADNVNNAQHGSFEDDGDLLNPSNGSPPTVVQMA